MRKALLSLFFLCFVFVSNAQQNLPSFNYVPQAPTTAAFTRYGDIPVDLSTGVTAISIPIYTLSENGINVPISISYHASGIKVSDVAGPVGLGWTLNAGGVITRTALGLIDEKSDFYNPTYYSKPFRNSSQFEDYNTLRDLQNRDMWAEELYHMINNPPNYGSLDFYSDRYYYSLANGESGVFRKDYITDLFKFMPYSPTKVRFFQVGNESLSDLKIEMTTHDGVRYIFKRNLYDLWYPEKIINSSNSDSVVFYSHFDPIRINTYSTSQEFGTHKTEAYVEGTGCNRSLEVRENPLPFSFMFQLDMKNDEVVLIDSIVGANSIIRFTYAEDRLDYQERKEFFAHKSRLSKIQVYSKAGALIKSTDFLQSYVPGDGRGTRMMLAEIHTGANGEEKHTFKYNAESLPDYYIPSGPGITDPAFLQDFWGYKKANGPVSYSTMFSDFAPSGADLYPNEDRAKASILEEIKYPTGGRTVFEYESNRVPTYFYGAGFSSPPADGKVGGLRIKKISSFAYEGAVPLVKTYEYVCNLPAEYGQLTANNFVYTQETYNVLLTGKLCGNGHFNTTFKDVCVSNAMGRYIGGPQAPVYYNKVTEYNGDGNKNTGKTVYYYQINQNNYGVPNEPRFTGPWERDLGSYKPPLEKKEEYKYENGQFKLVRKTETEYNDSYTERFSTGFNVASYLQFNAMEGMAPDDAFDFYNSTYNWYFSTLHYNDVIGYGLHLIPKKTSVYDYADGNNFVLSATEYTYNQYDQQTSATTTTSKGELLKSKFTYPVDYPAQAPYNTMVERNILAPVIEQSTYKNTTDPQNLLQSMKTKYNYWDYASQAWGNGVTNQILPQTVETKKGNNDVETRIRYFSYDQKANPVYVAKENDIRQVYIWSYNKAYPVAQVINVSDEQKQFVAYTSFEDADNGNWSVSGPQYITDDNTTPTGKKCLRITGLVHIDHALNAGSSYILSYWYKTGSAINVNANSTVLATSQPKNGWIYEKRRITGSSLLSISGSFGYIDELRLYPETAQMTTFSYEPLVGMTAQCDANDRITYYTYDASGRLTLVKDDNGNILKKICYNFQGQPDVCGENALPQWQLTGATRCKPCPQNPVYISNISQLEERDNNVNSETFGNTRWKDHGNCYAPADWQPTGTLRCRTLGGQNTGEQEREMKDMNPCSETGGNTRWDLSGTNTSACPLPAVFQSLDVSGVYYKQNCSSPQIPKPYFVSMPQGAFSSAIDIQDATNKAKAEAQRLANLNGECVTVYLRSVAVLKSDPSADQQFTDHYFYFYADAAGTIPLTLPITLGINYTLHQWWTENGKFAYDSGFDPEVFGAKAGGTFDFYPDLESTFCPHEWCWHQEIIIQPGPYVIIP